jgi:hypothetical protein
MDWAGTFASTPLFHELNPLRAMIWGHETFPFVRRDGTGRRNRLKICRDHSP